MLTSLGTRVRGVPRGAGDFFRRFRANVVEPSTASQKAPASGISLAEVVRRVHPTVLIGTSTARGAFAEEIVREMVAGTERPAIFPLSNPSSLSEALPADLIAWTDGRALVATGSPFAPVTYHGTTYVFGQANNALLFPGLGLAATISRAHTITDGMFTPAANTLAGMVDVGQRGAALLPHVHDLRSASAVVAVAVARAAAAEGVSRVALHDVEQQVRGRYRRSRKPDFTKGQPAILELLCVVPVSSPHLPPKRDTHFCC